MSSNRLLYALATRLRRERVGMRGVHAARYSAFHPHPPASGATGPSLSRGAGEGLIGATACPNR